MKDEMDVQGLPSLIVLSLWTLSNSDEEDEEAFGSQFEGGRGSG